jgi:ATP/maltotriose-dependent transcriptional regulator MalT
VPPLLARGYLALIDHLAGEVHVAERGYREAIIGLNALRRSRAASIFSRHLGDLLGNLRGDHLADARQAIDNAIHFAQEGGHEDVRYLALLSSAKLRIDHGDIVQSPEIHRNLDGVERYARVVGMPRLICTVNLARSRLLLRQGETERAAQLATESLEVSTMNDLRLLKISGLLVLAEIHIQRGNGRAARPLLELGERMAKAFNHHFALTRAQALALKLPVGG